MVKKKDWHQTRTLTPEKLGQARLALEEIQTGRSIAEAVRQYPLERGHLSKSMLVAAYYDLVASGEWDDDPALLAHIRMKPVRTLSGVATVTVLTKPYPCPGQCIFCPTDVRMPKSYLPDEPGAMRGLEHNFDPYAQMRSRLQALEEVGHPTDKVELLILGGTWSSYRRDYQEWFIGRCFEALNAGNHAENHEDSAKATLSAIKLAKSQSTNETAAHRNVGLVIETRPDEITPDEIRWLRHLGVTKIQMGAQSLDDNILLVNKRGHTVARLHRAVSLLRAGGFKIVLHWMPNLLDATLDSDRQDFVRLWQGICPDEIKIYPTQLLENTELYEYWQRGKYQPYTTEQLIELVADVKPTIPRYCRVNRIIRDIPSPHVVEGNKRTSLRQDVQVELAKRGTRCECIRCREVRGHQVDPDNLSLDDLAYQAEFAEEHFISYVTPEDQIAGFARLSLPKPNSPHTGIADLDGAAIIRELHVYGQSLPVGTEQIGAAQHTGLGTRLLGAADQVAGKKGYRRMAVIAAVGTRQYYLERGFERGNFYLVKTLG